MADSGGSNGAPIIIELGKMKKKAIKAFKRGEGDIMSEVNRVVEQAREKLGRELDNTALLPIVMVYKEKKKKKKGKGLKLPFLFG